jgi:hypothetical protein
MKELDFLPNIPGAELRKRLWEVFQKFEAHARALAGSNWVEIQRVLHCPNTHDWNVSGMIRIDANPDATGPLAHEVFHSAFHSCALHDRGADERWGDGFCDAFRYFMERLYGLGEVSGWFRKMDSFSAMTPDGILRQSTDGGHDRKYGIPASRIIRRANTDFETFTSLWRELLIRRSKSAEPILDSFFGFSPPP